MLKIVKGIRREGKKNCSLEVVMKMAAKLFQGKFIAYKIICE